LLFNFLGELIHKDSEQLLLVGTGSDLREKWITAAKRSCSEMLDSIGTNSRVKAVTLHRFQEKTNDGTRR